MCSTPRGSGRVRQVSHLVDVNFDYASHSKMLRHASDRIDQREAQYQQQAEATASDHPAIEVGTETKPLDKKRPGTEHQLISGKSLLSRLFGYLTTS